ncbi:DnaJ-domain-containing protein [Xylaria bambusicola]|uniref:DnaJ-domain-containing protein n=1 Tax=Xylaria bambusicola TaxID=326684 RepID=UPI0020089F97|nr:DnaJ-domain-containing protein [Xylaria bambusicola]KAI0506277.1 DnaJ-domain-containing protein [Xylaria bambusicola]
MSPRSAVSLLAAPAPIQRQCLAFLYPLPNPVLFCTSAGSTILLPQREDRNGLIRAQPVRRPFHATATRPDAAIDNARDHYETLKVAPTATPAEIKKSFYTLSKTHHPDLQSASDRRSAAKRFMRISEAYSILSSPSKRSKYDREHMNLSSPPPHHGSYSSTNPAGGRPASGLSKRRGSFTGPPPSFFRSGGWGSQSAKRRAAHEESTGSSSFAQGSSNPSQAGRGTMGGMGPGQDPFGHRDSVPHFDKEGHERTGRHSDRRREARWAAAERRQGIPVDDGPERGALGMFFVIGGVLLFSMLGPVFISRIWNNARSGSPKERKSSTGKV